MVAQEERTEWILLDHRVEALTDTIARRLRVGLLALLAFLLTLQATNGTPTAGWDVVVLLSAFATIGGILTWGPRVLGRTTTPPLAFELAGDACAALACLLLIDTSNAPLAWLLLAVPVLVAGVRHSMALAVLVWCSLIVGNVALELTYRPAALASTTLVLAAQLLTAVGVLGLPGSYLIRQLLLEANRRGAARQRAERQAAGVSLVATTARDLSLVASTREILDVTVGAIKRLGFSGAEVWVQESNGWVLSCRCASGSTFEDDLSVIIDADRTQSLVIAHADDAIDVAQSLHLQAAASVAVVPILQGRSVVRVYSSEPMGAVEVEWLVLLRDHVRATWTNVERADDLASRTAELAYEVMHDPLTGLPNRTHLLDVMARGLAEADQSTVLYVDLDGFKTINDTHGHTAGDLALLTTAQRMRQALRTEDVLARLAGDEFVVVLAVATTDEADKGDVHALATATAERLVQAVGQPFEWQGIQLQLSASVGIASARPDDEVHALLHRADQAMYLAKRAGGSRAFAAT